MVRDIANNLKTYMISPILLGFSFGVGYLGTFYFLKAKLL